MYKVFVNGKPLIFSTQRFSTLNLLEFKGEESKKKLLTVIERLEEDPLFNGAEIVARHLEKVWLDFCSFYKLIEAAGGVVKNDDKILVIYRLGKWDLPKGKMEKGESTSESALREVEEECGVSGLKIVDKLPEVMHAYALNGERILKITYWFDMRTSYKGALHPQIEEDISVVKWVAKNDMQEVFNNTYPSIKELLQLYMLQD